MLDTPNHSSRKRPALLLNNQDEAAVKRGICPTCNADTLFHFHGEQRWPEKVADKLGLSPLMHLWTCDTCHSTFAEAGSEGS